MSHARHALPGTLPWALLLLALPSTAAAQVQGYRLDPVHTRVVFGIDHAGFSTALGAISGSTGVIAFDPADWASARVDVRVPLQRIDLGDEGWNRAAARMLESASHPEARFIASRVEPIDATHARACCDGALMRRR